MVVQVPGGLNSAAPGATAPVPAMESAACSLGHEVDMQLICRVLMVIPLSDLCESLCLIYVLCDSGQMRGSH